MISNSKLILTGLIFLSVLSSLMGQSPLFPNSVVSNDIDFILQTDSDSFIELVFIGRENRETPQAPNGGSLFDTNTFVFEAVFSDDEKMEIWCHSSFMTLDAAKEYADKLGPRLGKLPAFQRNMINHVVIHKGDNTAFAEIEGQFFVLYSDNMDDRISTNDLEETVFHESVHASYQFIYEEHPDWISAQAADPTFVTDYAEDNPQLEDLAESALFAYTYLTHPGRLDSAIEEWLELNIPNRLEFFRTLYSTSTKVGEIKQDERLRVIPTSSNSLFTIHGISKRPNSQIFLLDVNGKLLKSIECSNQESVSMDLRDFATGLYFITTEGGSALRLLKIN